MSATEKLRKNGIRIERVPADLDQEIKRMGEKLSHEWVRSAGNEANDIFVPYYLMHQAGLRYKFKQVRVSSSRSPLVEAPFNSYRIL